MGGIVVCDILQLVLDKELLYLPITTNYAHHPNHPQKIHQSHQENPANLSPLITHPILTPKDQLILTELFHSEYRRQYSWLSQQSDTKIAQWSFPPIIK